MEGFQNIKVGWLFVSDLEFSRTKGENQMTEDIFSGRRHDVKKANLDGKGTPLSQKHLKGSLFRFLSKSNDFHSDAAEED